LSAKNPEIGVENTLGTIAAKVTIPTQRDPSVISKASHPRAMINAHAAEAEQVVAIQRFR
jgi:stress response protein YsnF